MGIDEKEKKYDNEERTKTERDRVKELGLCITAVCWPSLSEHSRELSGSASFIMQPEHD